MTHLHFNYDTHEFYIKNKPSVIVKKEDIKENDSIVLNGKIIHTIGKKGLFSQLKSHKPSKEWLAIKLLLSSNTCKKSYQGLFIELSKPNPITGISEFVYANSLVGKYKILKDKLGNGGSWWRKGGSLGRIYAIEIIKSNDPTKPIVAIRLNGYKSNTNRK